MGQLEIAVPVPSCEAARRHHRQKHRPTAISPWVHSRSLRSPGRLARLVLRPRAVGRLRAMDYGDIAQWLDASWTPDVQINTPASTAAAPFTILRRDRSSSAESAASPMI